MLRRVTSAPVAFFSATLPAGARSMSYINSEPIGKVHPDVQFGFQQTAYRGKGWANFWKQLPQECMATAGGNYMSGSLDRQGAIQDPEDPRHPIANVRIRESKSLDGSVKALVTGGYGPIPKGSRLLQVLYHNYLEPFSVNRVCVHLREWEKVPNNHHEMIDWTAEYVGQTCSLIGSVFVGYGACLMEGVTCRGDANQVYIMEGAQIMENCYLIADAPTTLHHYQRNEALNPYQTFDALDGVVRICMNVFMEANCVVEACSIGAFTRIGHNTKILKGVTAGCMAHILPGSVVLADTHIHDGEVWGGAPAVKLGKVSKFAWKKPWYHSVMHRDMVTEGFTDWSHYGDQVALQAEEMTKLDTLMIEYEKDLPPGVRKQMDDFMFGREPFNHAVARMTQGWTPPNHACKAFDPYVPAPAANPYRKHNDDSKSDYAGSVFNWSKYMSAERRW